MCSAKRNTLRHCVSATEKDPFFLSPVIFHYLLFVKEFVAYIHSWFPCHITVPDQVCSWLCSTIVVVEHSSFSFHHTYVRLCVSGRAMRGGRCASSKCLHWIWYWDFLRFMALWKGTDRAAVPLPPPITIGFDISKFLSL